MKDLPPPRDPVDLLGQAYEHMLEAALHEAHREEHSAPALQRIIDAIRHDIGKLHKLTEAEADKLADYLKRDLTDVATYMHRTGKELRDWLGFDLAVLEEQLRSNFARAADASTVEILKLKRHAETAEYHSGEITGPGTLRCDACGEILHFHQPARIPPCPRCRKARFHRRHD